MKKLVLLFGIFAISLMAMGMLTPKEKEVNLEVVTCQPYQDCSYCGAKAVYNHAHQRCIVLHHRDCDKPIQ